MNPEGVTPQPVLFNPFSPATPGPVSDLMEAARSLQFSPFKSIANAAAAAVAVEIEP